MKIKFKNQSYQDDAVNSIIDVFIGQTNGFRRDLIGRQIVDTGLFAHEEEII
jgi:restriction endonuclease